MFETSIQTLDQFKETLIKLSEDDYIKQCHTLSDATIGQHTRHIIELYQCLTNGYASGEVSYDDRKRDKRIEQELKFAIYQIENIQSVLKKDDKVLSVFYFFNGKSIKVSSNYFREVIYNLEHAIHHEALIKIALLEFTELILPASFGLAPSTVQYRKTCVQ